MLNASPRDLRARVLITGGERFSIVQDLDMRAGETINATFDVSDFEGGVLGAAAVWPSDAFALDDLAYAVVPCTGPARAACDSGQSALGGRIAQPARIAP